MAKAKTAAQKATEAKAKEAEAEAADEAKAAEVAETLDAEVAAGEAKKKAEADAAAKVKADDEAKVKMANDLAVAKSTAKKMAEDKKGEEKEIQLKLEAREKALKEADDITVTSQAKFDWTDKQTGIKFQAGVPTKTPPTGFVMLQISQGLFTLIEG